MIYFSYCPRRNAFERCSQFACLFFVKLQLELVRVTRETSGHRDPQEADPQQQDFLTYFVDRHILRTSTRRVGFH